MDVLVIGSGGREHALVWKLRQSPQVDTIYCAPGNGGIAQIAECIDLSADDVQGLVTFAEERNIGLTLVGPEVALTLGVVDAFEAKGLRVFGPDKKAADLEGSKVFMKDILAKYNIPSARYATFTDKEKALDYLTEIGAPVVIKADGLAAGKGVIVCQELSEAQDAIDLIMTKRAFGDAGDEVIIEEFLPGEEASFIAFTDGKTILPLPTSQDHKAVYEGDTGPNTGGMGAYSPAPVVTEDLHQQVMDQVMLPTIKGLAAEGRPYKGMLYAGLMIKNGQAKVLEFNCRFGDPEAQPLLMRLKNDLVDVVNAVIDGNLDSITLDIDPRPTVCVVMAAGGYPGSYEKGAVISGLDASYDDVVVFHAGTAISGDTVTSVGGRVLGVTAIGDDLQSAIDKAYKVVEQISWKDCYYRRDIGKKALATKVQKVGIIMGSDSDLPVMMAAVDFFKKMGVEYEITVASAHRTPARAAAFAETARSRGVEVIIAGAGMAAHLAGVLAAHTTIPVIGVPIDSSSLKGMDALLATVQMPPGIPVATMAVGKAGAKNAAILACQILAVCDVSMQEKLADFKREMAAQVDEKARNLSV